MLDNLLLGFSVALTFSNLLYAFIGVFVGNLIGVLPGIGALAAIAMLLPITYGLDPTGSLMMLAGIYYGTSFGGATTSILLNIPGTVSHAVVCLDGHPLAKKGRAGPAIFMAMFASFLGVSIGTLFMTAFSPWLAQVAFSFGPAEYFSLMAMGLLAASTLSSGSAVRAIAAVVIGLIFGCVGTDPNSGVWRFTFDLPDLADGVPLVALALAFFGVSDVLATAGLLPSQAKEKTAITKGQVRPTRQDMKESAGAMARGSLLGAFIGAIPGMGGALAAFISYATEKNVSKNPAQFGHGAIQGVSGPEAANSSADITSFIPTLTLGIPGGAVMALMMGALMIHDITPGPLLITQHPELFWGLVISFWVGNLMLLLLNIPLIGIWVRMLSAPYRFIFPIVIFLICIAAYASTNAMFDVGLALSLGVVAFFLSRLHIPPAPMLLGFILGPLLEENFRRALELSRGDLSVFITRPLSATFLGIIVALLLWVGLSFYKAHLRAKNQPHPVSEPTLSAS